MSSRDQKTWSGVHTRPSSKWAGALLLLSVTAAQVPSAVAFAADVASSRAQEARANAFRQRVKSEMEAAFGKPIKTQQDAINAAYLSVGWHWGEPQLDALDRAAYRKARSWGFRIEEFAKNGRGQKFALTDLSEAAIPPDEAPVERDPKRLVQMSVGAIDAPAKKQANVAVSTPAPDPNDARIEEVEQRVDAARQKLAAIMSEIAALEADTRAHPQNEKANAEKLRAAVKNLEALLSDSQQSVASIDAEVNALQRELTTR